MSAQAYCSNHLQDTGTVLVGDIGGTNARLSIWKDDGVHTTAEVYAEVREPPSSMKGHGWLAGRGKTATVE
jgi:2-keto-3-deoxy-galactonokinase